MEQVDTGQPSHFTGNHCRRGATQALPRPLVSVVVPCRNEAGFIESCLRSILSQQLPDGNLEIIVADGISTDGTGEILADMVAERHICLRGQAMAMQPDLRVIKNPGRIVSTGLNAAIRAARGDVIIRMDAHTVFAPDYIRQCVAVLEETGAENVGGPMRKIGTTYLERAIRTVYCSPFSVGGARSHNADYEGYVDTVIYGCWRKEAFTRFGLFDEELVRNQDDEHNLRIHRGGGRVYQSGRIRSCYHVRSSLTSLFRQFMQYGYWKVLVIKKHSGAASVRHFVPGLFVTALALTGILSLFWLPAIWGLGALLAAYLAAITSASLIAASRTEWKLLPILPVIFGCFHLGYGYGFVRGFFDFVLLHNAPSREFVRLTRAESRVEKSDEPLHVSREWL